MIQASPFTAAMEWIWPLASAKPKQDAALLDRIRSNAAALRSLPDSDLVAQTAALRTQVASGAEVLSESILTPGFALIFEAARRVLGIELYDVQLLGGLQLARGRIAEMQTGEGKTFTALLPAALHALTGNGVHVMTVNAYLAERDFHLIQPVYQQLGLSVGLIAPKAPAEKKRAAYACEVTYGLGSEFGFDYLRDQAALLSRVKPRLGESYRGRLNGRVPQQPNPMQCGHSVAIIDEADSVLLDEASTPLLLAAGGNDPAKNAEVYLAAMQAAKQLQPGRHFEVDRAASTLQMLQPGIDQLATQMQQVPRRGLDRPWRVYVEQALRAEQLYHRDVHYVLRDEEVQIVDQYTGRIFADRSWREGLQQAVQAKEALEITSEPRSIARITRQRYFQLYSHLCGMTGSAQGGEKEIRDVYKLHVAVIPPHRTCLRRTLPARVFAECAAKEHAIVEEVQRIHQTGQPVLVGVSAIESSERLASLLAERQVDFQLLNGKQTADEADIISQSGALGAVTIATNMAGRGTDIKLSPEAFAAGGLHVIVTEPQESTRVDRQLVGRAARQGDPGSSQLFVSAEDQLLTRHEPALSRRIKKAAGAELEVKAPADIAAAVIRLQQKVERNKAQHRKQMFAHDDWLDGVLKTLG